MRPGLLDVRAGSLGGLFIHQMPLASATLEAGLRPGAVLACFPLRLCSGPEGTQVGLGCSGPEEEVQAPRAHTWQSPPYPTQGGLRSHV